MCKDIWGLPMAYHSHMICTKASRQSLLNFLRHCLSMQEVWALVCHLTAYFHGMRKDIWDLPTAYHSHMTCPKASRQSLLNFLRQCPSMQEVWALFVCWDFLEFLEILLWLVCIYGPMIGGCSLGFFGILVLWAYSYSLELRVLDCVPTAENCSKILTVYPKQPELSVRIWIFYL